MSRPAVFLDRDGVLNAARVVDGRPHPPRGLDDLEILPGAVTACAVLADAGFALIGVTNQPDIARRTTDAAAVAAINERVRAATGLDAIEVCPHDDADGCACRKPKPGLILDAARRWDLDLGRSVTVGDRWRDVAAGRAAGTRTVFVDRRYDEPTAQDPDLVVADLEGCVQWIIETT